MTADGRTDSSPPWKLDRTSRPLTRARSNSFYLGPISVREYYFTPHSILSRHLSRFFIPTRRAGRDLLSTFLNMFSLFKPLYFLLNTNCTASLSSNSSILKSLRNLNTLSLKALSGSRLGISGLLKINLINKALSSNAISVLQNSLTNCLNWLALEILENSSISWRKHKIHH